MMNNKSEINELLEVIKEKCPDVIIIPETNFGEKPFRSGVWKLWLKDNEDVYLKIEVHDEMIWAIYPNKEFENKYPVDATKICNFLKGT